MSLGIVILTKRFIVAVGVCSLCSTRTFIAASSFANDAIKGHELRTKFVLPSGHTISVKKGDITRENAEAIVNAANEHLSHGGGLAAAIVRAGGRDIEEESQQYIREHGPVPTGSVAVTSAGHMLALHVIHAVGPYWQGGNHGEPQKLQSAIWNSLKAANSLKLNSIAIPAVSSGIFGYPKDECAKVVINTCKEFCERNVNQPPSDIRLTNFDEPTVSVFERVFRNIFPNATK